MHYILKTLPKSSVSHLSYTMPQPETFYKPLQLISQLTEILRYRIWERGGKKTNCFKFDWLNVGIIVLFMFHSCTGSPAVAPTANIPPNTSVPNSTLSSSSTLCVVCSGCKKILLKGQTAFQRKGCPQLFCSPRCLCSSAPIETVAMPSSKRTCHYCNK